MAGEHCSTIFNATTRSASRSNVQRTRPFGLGPRATAINFASFSPSNIGSTLGRTCFFRSNAAANPSSTNRFRNDSIVRTLTVNARAASASVHCGPASDSSTASNTWACRIR